MSWRSDSTQLIAGRWLSSAYAGHGVRAQDIPSEGTSGPAALFPFIARQGALPTDEMRWQILIPPAVGTFLPNEDSSFSYTGPDGTNHITFRGFINGITFGDFSIDLTIGVSAVQLASSSATLVTVGYATAQTEPKNSQHQQSTGQVISVAGFIANTSWINTVFIENVQHRETSATLNLLSRTNAQTTPTNSQHQQTAGQASTVTRFVATTSALNKILKLAAHISYIKTRSITKKTYQTSSRPR